MLNCFKKASDILSLNLSEISTSDNNRLDIPLDPQEFYKDFGYLTHPKTGMPVEQLTDYQYDIWRNQSNAKYRLVVKSQKVGLSTSALLEDFQKSLTTCRGKDILIVAQSQAHANEHLRTLKNLILNSEKYREFLITNPSELLLREERTKVGVAYIKNPDNVLKPSRIIALGSSETQVWSWKSVAHIHCSDIAATKLVDDSSLFAAMFSRLANTDGTMLVETPPRSPKGKTWEIYEKYYLNKEQSDLFKIFVVKAEQVVKSGLITSEFLEAEKVRLGPLFPQFYCAEFLSIGGNVFPQELIDHSLELGEKYEKMPVNPYCLHIGGLDFGFSSSVTALYVGEVFRDQQTGNKLVRIIEGLEYDKQTPSFIANEVHRLHVKIPHLSWFVDASNRAAVNEIKSIFNERLDWEKTEDVNPDDNLILPVAFQKEHKQMLQHMYMLLTKGKLAIPKKFNKLETALRTAFALEFDLNKDQTLEDDVLDATRLLLKGVKFKTRE